MTVTVTVNAPEKMTKQLALKSYNNGRRKVVISSNWLSLIGFTKGAQVVERSLGKGKGFVVELVKDLFADLPTKKVYQRSYPSRKNSPLELQLETASQRLLDEAIPADCERVHITFTQGLVTVVPITTHQQRAIANAKSAEDRLSAFAACTSGVDLQALTATGFAVHSVLELRPVEPRDKQDFTETGALAALANTTGIRNLYNEDIMTIDLDRVAQDVAKSPFTLLQMSPTCKDHSAAKGKSLKERALEDMQSSLDMGFDVIRLAERLAPPVIMLENVNWLQSDIYKVISLRLRRLGYSCHELLGDARDYEGLSSRKRAYSVFTALPVAFEFEPATPRRTTPIWDEVVAPYLHECRDVTHSKSIQDGFACGRLRMITPESTCSPTIMRSQKRGAKDSVVAYVDGRFYMPSENMMKRIMGIPESFDLNCCGETIASEIIGQAVELGFHQKIISAIRTHILRFFESIEPAKPALAS